VTAVVVSVGVESFRQCSLKLLSAATCCKYCCCWHCH